MTYNVNLLLICGLLSLVFFSCTEPKPVILEINEERWTLSEKDGEFKKDSIQFLEKYLFNDDGVQQAHVFYNTDGSLRAKDKNIFKKGEKYPVGSQYLDANNKPLSIYEFEFDDGLKKEARAFEVATKELLRLERYNYDQFQNLIQKDILNITRDTVRTLKYSYDENGNEKKVEVYDNNKKMILAETFQIKKLDKNKAWTEKWGFVNDKPFSYRVRTIRYKK